MCTLLCESVSLANLYTSLPMHTDKYLRPYFSADPARMHVYVGETFMQDGVQFKITACEPENGTLIVH